MIRQSKSLQTRYDTKHIYDKYCIKTHVYTFRFCVKKACLNYHEFDLEGDHIGGTTYMVFIGPVFHNNIYTCLKRVGHGGNA